MPTNTENARTAAFRSDVAKVLSNGITLTSPLWAKCFHARRGAPGMDFTGTKFDQLKGVDWNAGGQDGTNGDHRWPIVYQIPTALTNRGELGTRSFAPDDPAKLAGLFYYNHEVTGAISKRDMELRQGNDTQIFNLEVARAKGCVAAMHTLFRKSIWNTSETNQCGGFSHILLLTAVAAATTYAGIAMSAANTYWTPAHYDYGTLTLAANAFEILQAMAVGLTRSDDAGGGEIKQPDFACFNSTSWLKLLTYLGSKSTIANAGVMTKGVFYERFPQVMNIGGIDCLYDDYFAGTATAASQYLDSDPAEDFIMGHSDKVSLRTTHSSGQGLITTISEDSTPEMRGKVWVYETGMQMLKFESPIWFGLGHT
jgi:hypothetical protein